MMFTKKAFFIVAALISAAFSVELNALNKKLEMAFATTMLLTGPCIVAANIKNLSLAKALKGHDLSPSVEEMAYLLQKRGRTGLALGVVLSSVPLGMIAYSAHQ